jgi:hypothetical protein
MKNSREKAKAGTGVLLVERWILARLRKHTFRLHQLPAVDLSINWAGAITLNMTENRIRDTGKLNVMVRRFLPFEFYVAHLGPKIESVKLKANLGTNSVKGLITKRCLICQLTINSPLSWLSPW